MRAANERREWHMSILRVVKRCRRPEGPRPSRGGAQLDAQLLLFAATSGDEAGFAALSSRSSRSARTRPEPPEGL